MLFVLVISVTLFYGSQGVHPCSTSTDCRADECCVTSSQMDGKRAIGSAVRSLRLGIRGTLGTCQKLGTNASRCLVNSGGASGIYFTCPCTSGLVCKGSGMYEVPYGETGTCTPTPGLVAGRALLASTCGSGADCPEDECCITTVSRRSNNNERASGWHYGFCVRMATEVCSTTVTPGKPEGVVFNCPCAAGLTCRKENYPYPNSKTGGLCEP